MLVSSVQKNDSVAHFTYSWASLVAQRLKRLPPMRETQVWSLGWEDSLEKEMVTHSSILAWRIPWTEEPGGLQCTGSQRVRHDWATSPSPSLTELTQSFLLWMRTSKIYSLNDFQIYKSVLSSIIIMLYNTCLELIYLLSGNLYLWPFSPSSPTSAARNCWQP